MAFNSEMLFTATFQLSSTNDNTEANFGCFLSSVFHKFKF